MKATDTLKSASEIVEKLPSGSGIDSDWVVDSMDMWTMVLSNSYHAMNGDTGMYWGWIDFSVEFDLRTGEFEDVNLETAISDDDIDECPALDGLCEYLEDTLSI